MPDRNYAAADCGSNSFHLIIVRVRQDGSFEIAAREKEVIRLAKYKNNIIPSEAIERSIQVLQNFKETARMFTAPLAVAATSALRNALNKDEFIREIYQSTGIIIRILSGEEEAALTFSGVMKSLLFNNSILCIDIGGGSTEFIIGKEEHFYFAKSIEIGAVKLSTKFFKDDHSFTAEEFNECYKWTTSQINDIKSEVTKYEFDQVVGASGTIISAASILSGGSIDLNNYRLKRDAVKEIYSKLLSANTIEERKKIKGLEPARADIIPAGIIILRAIFDVFDLEEMIVSTFGLREGIIINTFLSNNKWKR